MSNASTASCFSRIPTRDSVFSAASAMPHQPPRWAGQEGPRWRLTITPGGIRQGTKDYARLNSSEEERTRRRLRDNPHMDDEPAPRKRDKISDWSAKSRANMCWTFAAVDYAPLVARVAQGEPPALVTLTLPGDWLAVAPDGESFKKMVAKFRKRFTYSWGEDIAGIWKLEFQRRGAPHLHILTVPPSGVDLRKGRDFVTWLSETWAACVDASAQPDKGEHVTGGRCGCSERCRHLTAGTGVDFEETLRYADTKRIAVYFSKHGTFSDKEYQNVVPSAWSEPGKGPGRFWGVWKLDVLKANVEVADNAQYAVARHMRRVVNAGSYSRSVTDVPGWTDRATGELHDPRKRSRPVNRRVRRMQGSRGFISVNDGPAVAAGIARVIDNHVRNHLEAGFFDVPSRPRPRAGRVLHHDFDSSPGTAREDAVPRLDLATGRVVVESSPGVRPPGQLAAASSRVGFVEFLRLHALDLRMQEPPLSQLAIRAAL